MAGWRKQARPAGGTLLGRHPPRAAGFTLLEVLIAFVIAALALAALFQAATGGLRAVQVAGQYQQALARARSRLAAIGAGALVPGTQSGEDAQGFRWRVRVAPLAVVPTGRSGAAVTLYAVTAEVAWKDGDATRDIRLDTERVGPTPQAAP